MNRLQALVALNLSGAVGSMRLKALLEVFASPEEIFSASLESISAVRGIGPGSAERILAVKEEDIVKELQRADKLGLKVKTIDDADYPHHLKFIPDPPPVLYLKGSFKPEDNLSVAIVGSRRASVYGLQQSGKFASGLAEKGFTVVSGLARGVDTCAHRSALKMRGRTIAVMGSGFNNIYPAENKRLSVEIAENGAVVSEFPLDAQPLKEHFPQRNRVISGLSLGVLVIEAARNSGALITASAALEQGREVFALPGRIDSANSYGVNGLISDGAKLVSGVDDIIEELNLGWGKAPQKARGRKGEAGALGEEERALYGLLQEGPLGLDELVEKIDFGITDISAILLKLQLKKLVKELPGKQFAVY